MHLSRECLVARNLKFSLTIFRLQNSLKTWTYCYFVIFPWMIICMELRRDAQQVVKILLTSYPVVIRYAAIRYAAILWRSRNVIGICYSPSFGWPRETRPVWLRGQHDFAVESTKSRRVNELATSFSGLAGCVEPGQIYLEISGCLLKVWNYQALVMVSLDIHHRWNRNIIQFNLDMVWHIKILPH